MPPAGGEAGESGYPAGAHYRGVEKVKIAIRVAGIGSSPGS